MSDVDPTKLKDRGAYYRARVIFLEQLLTANPSPKQRREAEDELKSVSIKARRHSLYRKQEDNPL